MTNKDKIAIILTVAVIGAGVWAIKNSIIWPEEDTNPAVESPQSQETPPTPTKGEETIQFPDYDSGKG